AHRGPRAGHVAGPRRPCRRSRLRVARACARPGRGPGGDPVSTAAREAPVEAAEARPRRGLPWTLVAALILTLPLVTPRIRGADEIEYFSYLRSAVFDRDLEFGNEYERF